MTRRQALAVAGTAGLLVVLAALVRLTPVGLPDAGTEPVAAPALPAALPAASTPSGDVGGYAGIVEGNLFAPDRNPPPPAETGEAPVVAAQGEGSGPELPRYRLSGIVEGPDGFVALIDADPAFPGAELYRVGDSVGPFVLEQATDSTVVLRRGRATRTLRLDSISGRPQP